MVLVNCFSSSASNQPTAKNPKDTNTPIKHESHIIIQKADDSTTDKARNSETFKFVHMLASVTFKAPYFHYIIQTIGHVSIPKRHSFSPLCLFCACGSSVLQNFKILYVGKNKSTLATNMVMRYFILHTAFMDRKSTLKKQRGR
jgi:hypothetical protein